VTSKKPQGEWLFALFEDRPGDREIWWPVPLSGEVEIDESYVGGQQADLTQPDHAGDPFGVQIHGHGHSRAQASGLAETGPAPTSPDYAARLAGVA
jgi:hypothetical protein